MTEPMHEDQSAIVAAYRAGEPVPRIAARYALTPAEVHHLVAITEGQDSTDNDNVPIFRQRLIEVGKVLGGVVIAVLLLAWCGGAFTDDEDSTEPDRDLLPHDAKRVCQEDFIPKRLKAPATAQFENVEVQAVAGSADTFTVTGSVDAQNSFGARIRSTFTCTVRSAGNQWVLQDATVN